MHLFDNPQILLCNHCILCMISFSISYIRKYYLEPIHPLKPTNSLHIYWCVYSAHRSARQKCTYKCAPKAHLQVRCRCTPKAHLPLIYILAAAPVRSAPTGAHQEHTYRCTVGAHQKCTYPSFTYLHQHLLRAHLQVCTKSARTGAHQKRTYRCTPKAHLQVPTKSTPTGTHQKHTYRYPPKAHLQVPTKSTPTGTHQKCTYRWPPKAHIPHIYIFAPVPKGTYHCIDVLKIQMTAHLTRIYIWAHLLCRCAAHLSTAGSPNWDQRCNTPWLRFPIVLGVIVLDLQDQI